MTTGPYINDPGYEVPDNKIVVIPNDVNDKFSYLNIIESLKGKIKRDWFNEHFYYCLPLNIANQYGFIIKSTRTFEATWDGQMGPSGDVSIKFLDADIAGGQIISSHFGSGIVTIQNAFHLKTPPGINLMTIQPPNIITPGFQAMAGVVESDQLRRDFTFNIKLTDKDRTILVKAGDPIGAFMPIPRYFVDGFEIAHIDEIFDISLHLNEQVDGREFARQRASDDLEKSHEAGRKYFNGIHAFGEKYTDHQKRIS